MHMILKYLIKVINKHMCEADLSLLHYIKIYLLNKLYKYFLSKVIYTTN